MTTGGEKTVFVTYGEKSCEYKIYIRLPEPSLDAARLEVDGDKIYLTVEGACAGYSASDLSADIQETSGAWAKIPVTCRTTVNGGTFKLSADITGRIAEGVAYISHVYIADTEFDVFNLSAGNQTLVCGGVTYSLTVENVFGNGNQYVVIRRA